MKYLRQLALVGATGLLLAGCEAGVCGGNENELTGSIGELYDINVDAVEARWSEFDDTVTVDFKRGTDSHAKVIANMVSNAQVGAKIPLISGDVYRVTSEESDTFPSDIARGFVTFESSLKPDSPVFGCFTSLFVMDDGSQRTLKGDFNTTLTKLEDF